MKRILFFTIVSLLISANTWAQSATWTGTGSINDPYQIGSLAQLSELKDSINNTAIDYSGKHFSLITNITLTSGWTPIGTEARPFSGIFNGTGKWILNLEINTTANNIGLFGFIKNGMVRNLNVATTTSGITANLKVGGIVGTNDGGYLDSCHVSGKIVGNTSVGGVVGENIDGTITNCYTICNVSGSLYTGGLVGRNTSEVSNKYIESCYTTGSVSGNSYIGGLIGLNDRGNIENCFTNCTVSSTGIATGGLAGSSTGGSVKNSFSLAKVTSTGSYAGGFMGMNGSTITGCYSIPNDCCNFLGSGTSNGIGDIKEIRGELGEGWSTYAWDVSGNNYPYLKLLPKQLITLVIVTGLIEETITINTNTAINEPDDPFQSGYLFDGWYETYSLNKWNFSTNITSSYYIYAKWTYIPNATKAAITTNPQNADLCVGSNHTLTVSATGSYLRYQWYKNEVAIKDATSDTYSIKNATPADSGYYYVTVQALVGEIVKTEKAHISVANPLPANITFANVPQDGKIETGLEYVFEVNRYNDASLYKWSSSSGTVKFMPETGANTKAFFMQEGYDVVNITVSNACGERVLSYPVRVDPSSGSENIEDAVPSIYPNPVSDILNIIGLTAGEVIKLYNASGSLIATYTAENEKMSINISSLASGVYYLSTSNKTMKVIKN